MIKLGDKVRDVVTGYEGIATAKTEYLNGCIQITVCPKQNAEMKKSGTYPEAIKLDIEELIKVGDGVNVPKLKVVRTRTGGPPRKAQPRK